MTEHRMFTGFEIIGTGGNCEALIVTLADGRAMFITDGDAQAEPAADAYFVGLFPSYRAAIEWEDGDELIERYRGYDSKETALLSEALAELLNADADNILHQLAVDFMEWCGDFAPLSLDEFLIQHRDTLTPHQRQIGCAILGMFDVCADTYYTLNR